MKNSQSSYNWKFCSNNFQNLSFDKRQNLAHGKQTLSDYRFGFSSLSAAHLAVWSVIISLYLIRPTPYPIPTSLGVGLHPSWRSPGNSGVARTTGVRTVRIANTNRSFSVSQALPTCSPGAYFHNPKDPTNKDMGVILALLGKKLEMEKLRTCSKSHKY